MSEETLSTDQIATPKTDSEASRADEYYEGTQVVLADFARAQERRIAELESMVATLERSNHRLRAKFDRSYP